MTDKLKEIEAAAKGATPGRWICFSRSLNDEEAYEIQTEADMDTPSYEVVPPTCMSKEDGDFIAAANPQTVLWLCEMVEEMKAHLKHAKEDGHFNHEKRWACSMTLQKLEAGPGEDV